MTRQCVLITGGARRVGEAFSRYFAAQGYDIALHYNQSKAEAERVKKDIEATGVACTLFQHDLTDAAGITVLMTKVQKAMPHCVALINNASIFERAPLMETDEALFDRQFAINLKAPFFLTQAFARQFGKGCVVNILDAEISQTHGSHFAYLLSKKALAEFTAMAARELGPAIRVNGVCPGFLLPSAQADEAYEERLKTMVPLKSNASLEEVANAAHWLVTQPHVTGQLIFVDGGHHVL